MLMIAMMTMMMIAMMIVMVKDLIPETFMVMLQD